MNLYDMAYSIGLGISAPVWALFPSARQKIRRARAERWGDVPTYSGDAKGILLHAVSVGELNATPKLVKDLSARRPELRFCITSTTDTGSVRLGELYGSDPRIATARFPVDFSGPVDRLLDRQRPAVAVLMELEVWPNFMLACTRRKIPVIVINGRLTTSSFRGYQRTARLTGKMFCRLTMVCAQDQTYADRFIALGVPRERVIITGTMKFDTATVADRIAGSADLAAAVGLRPGAEPIWVCGSTGPGEESAILAQFAILRKTIPALRLVIVPRHPPRFDEVAALIQSAGYPLIRRSATVGGVIERGLPAPVTASEESAQAKSQLISRLPMPASDNLPAFMHQLLEQQAASVAGTEAAGFIIERTADGPALCPIDHIRNDNSSPETRAAAIKAFADLAKPCVEQGKDGAIEVGPPNEAGESQYCLITLLRDEAESFAVSTVITRCVNIERARQRLISMQFAAGYFELSRLRRSPSGAGNPGSATPATNVPPVILGDTMGELRKFYSVADVVFVGRTLVDLGPRQHGSDMIEPAALAKPVIVGPYTANFADVMSRFRAAKAIREIKRADELAPAVADILAATSSELGPRAQQVVRESQGATAKNADVIVNLL